MRIRNILRWKKPKLWVCAVSVVLCLACLIGCAMNPAVQPTEFTEGNKSERIQSFVSDKLIYLTGLSSIGGSDDSGYRYIIDEDSFVQIIRSTGDEIIHVKFSRDWEVFPYEAEAWKQMFDWGVKCEDSAVYFLDRREDTGFRYINEEYFLLHLDGTMYICHHYKHPNGDPYFWDIYSLKEEPAGRDIYGVDDPVVEYAMDRMDDITFEFEAQNVTVTGGEILRIEQVPTGTVSESLNIALFAFDYRLAVELPEEGILDEGLAQTVTSFRPGTSWREYPERFRYEEGWIVPEKQSYLLLVETIADNSWTPLWITTEEEIQGRFGTEEMLAEYGSAYTAAAMELYGEYRKMYG